MYEFVPSWYSCKSSPVPNLMLALSGISTWVVGLITPVTPRVVLTVAAPVTARVDPSNVRLASSTNAATVLPVKTLLFVKVTAPVPP